MQRRLQQSDSSGGALVGSHPGPEEESRAHRVAGQSEPIRQTEENAVSQEAEPQRVDPLAAESAPAEAGVASAGATGPQAAPPNPAVTGLGLALELYRKGDMTGGDRAKSENYQTRWIANSANGLRCTSD